MPTDDTLPAPSTQAPDILGQVSGVAQSVVDSILGNANKPAVNGTTGTSPSADGTTTNADGSTGPAKPVTNASFSDLVNFGQKISQQMQGLVGTVMGVQGKADAAAAKTQDAVAQSGEADQTIINLQQAQAVKQKTQDAAVAGAAGLDPNQSTYTLLKDAEDFRNTREEAAGLGKQLADMKGTSIFDDPFAWIRNQFTQPFVQDRYDQLQTNLGNNAKNLKEAEDMTSEAFVKNAAIDTATGAPLTAALLEKSAADTTAKSAAASMEAAKFDLSAVNPMMAATGQQWEIAKGINGALAQQQELQMGQQRLDIEKQSSEYTRQAKEVLIEGRQETLEGNQQIDAQVSAANSVLGTNVAGHVGLKSLVGADRDNFMTAMGYAGTQGTAGYNISSSVDNLQKLPGRSINPGQSLTIQKLDHYMAPALTTMGAMQRQTGMKIDPETRLNNLNTSAEAGLALERGNVPIEGGVYSMPTLGKILGTPSAQGKAPDLVKTLEPLATADPLHATKPVEVYGAALDAMDKTPGLTAAKMASQIKEFYLSGGLLNNSTNGYRTLNVPVLSEQNGFRQQVGTGAPVNQFSQSEIENKLIRMQIARKANLAGVSQESGLGNADTLYTGKQ